MPFNLIHMHIPFFKKVGNVIFFCTIFSFFFGGVDFTKAFGQEYIIKIAIISFDAISKFKTITYVFKPKILFFTFMKCKTCKIASQRQIWKSRLIKELFFTKL